jgi:tripartite ATP-independent transporter DctM subunit
MGIEFLTLLLFSALILSLIVGIPISFCMGGVAALFILFCFNPSSLSMITSVAYGVMDNFVLTAIPLFVLMGAILQRSGVAEDAYSALYNWIGTIKGGLAVATVLVCTIFAACTGISGAATVAMGVIALPSMLKRGYDKLISIGCIATAGGLGILIPPSVIMIMYGVFAGESIGQLYAGGVFPGLLLASLYIIYILARSYLKPSLCPPIPQEERLSLKEKLRSLWLLLPPMFLIIIVLGSLFRGICTPTEAAAIGAAGSIICALLRKRFSLLVLKDSCRETLRLSGMVIWIIIGGSCFSSIYTSIGAVELIKNVTASLEVSKYVVLAGMQFILFILGCLMDPGGILMITTPVFVPVIKMLDFDPVWYGVLFVINMEMAYITPPFGFNLFYMKSIVPPGVTMQEIYRSIAPFVVLQAIGLVICIIFPEIILWLPQKLFGGG